MNATATSALASGVADYPVHLEIEYQEEYPRWLPFFAAILLIPHFIALFVLAIVSYVAQAIAFFAVLFTAKYPEGIFNFQVGVHRWGARVAAYYFWMSSKYPPFSLEPDPGDTVRYSVDYPADGMWGRLRVFQGILLIPYMIALSIFGLVVALMFIPFFTILFSKRFPKGIFDLMLIYQRWNARAIGYMLYMVKKYPPFELA